MSKKKQTRCTETIDIEDLIAEREMKEYAEMRDLIEYEKELDQYRRKPTPIQISIAPKPAQMGLKWWEIAIILIVVIEVGRVAIHTFANL